MKYAVYCGTRNLYEAMIPAVNSLLYNSDVDHVFLLIEDDSFPFPLPNCVSTINVSNQQYFSKDGPNFQNAWTYMVLMRAAMHRIFPDLDRIVSLDVDTIAAKDVSGLWDYPIDDYWLAGAKEPYKSSEESLYINAGVMLMNLKKLREDGKGDEIIEHLNTFRYLFPEQDCINRLCQGGIYKIPSDYNANNYTEPTTTPKLIHFAAVRGYQRTEIVKIFREMPMEIVMWKHELNLNRV